MTKSDWRDLWLSSIVLQNAIWLGYQETVQLQHLLNPVLLTGLMENSSHSLPLLFKLPEVWSVDSWGKSLSAPPLCCRPCFLSSQKGIKLLLAGSVPPDDAGDFTMLPELLHSLCWIVNNHLCIWLSGTVWLPGMSRLWNWNVCQVRHTKLQSSDLLTLTNVYFTKSQMHHKITISECMWDKPQTIYKTQNTFGSTISTSHWSG